MTDVAVGSLDTPVGLLSISVTRTGLADVTWAPPEAVEARWSLPMVRDGARLDPVLDQLGEYFAGRLREFELTIDWQRTSPLQQGILQTLYSTVEYGAAVTYGELARRSGTGVPARGIGSVMGANPVPIVVPCHRVVASDGLGGYSGGSTKDRLEVKRWLLTMEGALPPTLDWDPAGPA